MSQLFFTERGRILAAHNEEITRWQWARKLLTLPRAAASTDADLWLFVHEYRSNREPLQIRINQRGTVRLAPDARQSGRWSWRSARIPRRLLRVGRNEFLLQCDSPAMNAWTLGIENGHPRPRSFVSTDRGATWSSDGMGAHHALRGDYLVRLRSCAPQLRDPVPHITYENPLHPRVRELLPLIPRSIQRIRDPWNQLLQLRTWVSVAWKHDASGHSYAPWDPWTILDWAGRGGGHGLGSKITMCVHFAVTFVALATALGHRARCVLNTAVVNSQNGHFVAEAWDGVWRKWVVHDPNLDVHYEDRQEPLSSWELADRARRGLDFKQCERAGPGLARQPAHIAKFARKIASRGVIWLHTGIWMRNNFVSRPGVAPPSHGTLSYTETDVAWYAPTASLVADLAMFPYRIPTAEFFRAEQ